MNSTKICLKFYTKPDLNGNPRKLFLVLDEFQVIEAIDIGYRDFSLIRNMYPDIKSPALELKITIGEYKRLLRIYSKNR